MLIEMKKRNGANVDKILFCDGKDGKDKGKGKDGKDKGKRREKVQIQYKGKLMEWNGARKRENR